MHEPQLLVLDEPTVGLDIESRAVIWEVLRDLRDQGTTVLLSSHYLEEVEALADRMAIIDAGRVIAEGSPESLKQELGGDRVTLRVREFSDQPEAERCAIYWRAWMASDGLWSTVLRAIRSISLWMASMCCPCSKHSSPALISRCSRCLRVGQVWMMSICKRRVAPDGC